MLVAVKSCRLVICPLLCLLAPEPPQKNVLMYMAFVATLAPPTFALSLSQLCPGVLNPLTRSTEDAPYSGLHLTDDVSGELGPGELGSQQPCGNLARLHGTKY